MAFHPFWILLIGITLTYGLQNTPWRYVCETDCDDYWNTFCYVHVLKNCIIQHLYNIDQYASMPPRNELEALEFRGSNIKSVNGFAFDGLIVMVHTIFDGGFEWFSDYAFENFECRGRLIIKSNNKLRSLTSDLFYGIIPTHLTHLSIRDNKNLTLIPAGIFNPLTKLWKLNLSDNRLAALDGAIFRALSQLKELDIRGNPFTSLHRDWFQGLPLLWKIEMDTGKLTGLSAGIFRQMTALKYLDLFTNRLTGIPSGLFGDLRNLKELYLGGDRLSSIPIGSLSFPNIKTLHLVHWAVNSVHNNFVRSSTTLRQLKFQNGSFYSLDPEIFFGLTDLEELQLIENRNFNFLGHETFHGLSKLKILSLRGNKIVHFAFNLFEPLTSLTDLYLDQDMGYLVPNDAETGICSRSFIGLSARIHYSRKVDKCAYEFSDGVTGLQYYPTWFQHMKIGWGCNLVTGCRNEWGCLLVWGFGVCRTQL